MKLLNIAVATGAALACSIAYAAKVTELTPEQVDAFLTRPGYVVVQLTSPDRRCKYCIGADKTFDQAAAESTAPDTVFARVQWPVWYKAPKLGTRLDGGGVPVQIVFKDGKEQRRAGGRPESASVLLSNIDKIRQLPPAPGKDVTQDSGPEQAAQAPHTPLTTAQQDALRLYTRKDLLKELVAACGKLAPPQAPAYERALQTWTVAHAAALNEAAMLKLSRSSREDASEETALTQREMRDVEAWMAKDLNITRTKGPGADSCRALSAYLEAGKR
ncbi:thioredoxin family protein [Massilia sp. P8910]|uniref:thioredoxin family protein n=1 Tax=Massilia antarctica TaxID=2765360 RepID=UPI001E2CA2A6|nr:thioredoxin family protein [Massilia antarctica]MCE3606348.1 thioredoxin family protein [Massilia antarctica]